ncbi:MAG TPA: hypothetical protein ENO23_06945, partial [Alphaproteobacteria bacterium]|nr:hypothetical protein [Alphaproteobacteria bacterium]
MADRPKLPDAVQLALKLGFPPTTLALKPGQAAGHRLARAVNVKGATPDRSFAVVHGLAVISADVVGHGETAEAAEDPGSLTATHKGTELTRHVPLAGAPSESAGATGAASGSVSLRLRPQPATGRREDSLERGEAVAVTVGSTVPRGADMVYPFDLLDRVAAAAPGATPAQPVE